MQDFKIGDRVKVIKCRYGMDYGDIFTLVEECEDPKLWRDDCKMEIEYGEHFFDYVKKGCFKLYEEKQEMKSNVEQFDMKTQPWYIRVNNEEEFNLVKEFIYKSEFSFAYGEDYDVGCGFTVAISNYNRAGKYSDAQCIRETCIEDTEGFNEIKMNFKTVIDSVVFPVVESEKDKQIRELQNTIELAQKQINQLKEMK